MKKRLTKARLRIRNRNFRLAYLIFVLLFVAAALIGLRIINSKLADYEEGLPTTRMAKIVNYSKTGDVSVFAQALPESDRSGDAFGTFEYFMSEAASSGVTYTSVPTSDANALAIFRLVSKGVTFAEMTLLPIEKPDEIRDWAISEIAVKPNAIDKYFEFMARDKANEIFEKLSLGDYSDMYRFIPNSGYAEDTPESFEAYMRSVVSKGEIINLNETVNGDKRTYSLTHRGAPYFEFTISRQIENGLSTFVLESARAYDDTLSGYRRTFADVSARGKLPLFDGGDYTELYALCVSFGYPDGGADEFCDLMAESIADSKLSLGAYASEDEKIKRYGVLADNETIAEFELSDIGTEWAITDVEIMAWQPFSAYVEVPYVASVYANGKLLDKANAEVIDISSSVNARVAQNAPDMAKRSRYHVETVYKAPVIEVYDASGRLLETSAEGDVISAYPLTDDEALKPLMHDRILEVSNAFSYYMYGDLTLNGLANHVQSKSPAYNFLKNADTKWVKQHNKRDNVLSNFDTHSYYSYSDTLFSCEVYYDYTLSYKYAGVVTYPTPYRFYFEYTGGKWMLYDFALSSKDE